MAASGVGAAIALAAVRDAWAGEVVFLGTPAEERGSGKAIMIREGLFEGLDAALLYHPCDRNHVEIAPLASEDVHVTFTGLRSPRGVGPVERAQRPRRDDRAVRLGRPVAAAAADPHAASTGSSRRAARPRTSFPDRTKAWFMLRSADQAYYETMKRRFIAMCEAAASASDVEVEVEFSGGATTMNHNARSRERWVANAEAAGVIDQGMDPASGSTDMANVSWVVPTIHPELSITRPADPRPHDRVPRRRRPADAPTRRRSSPRRSSRRRRSTSCCDPALVEAAWAEFKASTAG